MSYQVDKLVSNSLSWKPTLKQERFLALPWSIREGFYAGAAGAGKSDVLLMYPVVHSWVRHPKFKGLFLRRTIDELREEIFPRAEEYFTPLGATWNERDKCWRWPEGGRLFFGHCEYEKHVHKYDTAQWNYVAFDELTSFTLWQYMYITFQRVRRDVDTIGILPAVVRCASNPGNIGHAWVRERFVDPVPEGNTVIIGKGGNKRIFIPATLDDNPYIDPEYKQSLDALDEAERKAKKFGLWSAYEGSVFTSFREERLESEPENALHVIAPFDIPEWWPKVVVIDWGYDAMTWVGYGAISPKKRVYVYREQSFVKTDIELWTIPVKEFIVKEKPKEIVMCRSAGQHRGSKTIQQQVSEALDMPIGLADSSPGSRISGKMLLHEYLRFEPKELPKSEVPTFDQDYAEWLLRQSITEYKLYLSLFQPKDKEDNLPKLQIFDTCPLLVKSIQSCVYSKTIPEDVEEFKGDDPYDGIRYMLELVERWTGDASKEMKRLEEQQALIEKLQHTKDFTTFYRQAAALDRTANIKPVMRYRSRYRVH